MNISQSSTALRWLRGLVAATAVCAAGAQAATFNAVWDPPFGSPFGNVSSGLGWRGNASIYVPDTCEPSGSGLVDNYGNIWGIPGNCGGQAAVTSAYVELYDVASTAAPTLATLTFNPASFYVGVLQYVGGELEGLMTDFSNLLTPASDTGATPANLAILDAFGPLNPWSTQFSLIFTLDGPRLAWLNCTSSEVIGASTHGHSQEPRCTGGLNSDAPGFRPEFTISRVPEPSSLALACLGLLAFGRRYLTKR